MFRDCDSFPAVRQEGLPVGPPRAGQVNGWVNFPDGSRRGLIDDRQLAAFGAEDLPALVEYPPFESQDDGGDDQQAKTRLLL